MPDRHRSLRLIALLVAGTAGARAYGALDACGLCEALRQATEERRHRCRGDLRGSYQGQHAVCRDQNAGAAELPDAPPHTCGVQSIMILTQARETCDQT